MEHKEHKKKLNINYVIPVVNNHLTKGQQLYTQQQLKQIVTLEKSILRKEKKFYTTTSHRIQHGDSIYKLNKQAIRDQPNIISSQFLKIFKHWVKIFPRSVQINTHKLDNSILALIHILRYSLYDFHLQNNTIKYQFHPRAKIQIKNMIEKTDLMNFVYKFMNISCLITNDDGVYKKNNLSKRACNLLFLEYQTFDDLLYHFSFKKQKILLTFIVEKYKYICFGQLSCLNAIINNLISHRECNIDYIKSLLRKLCKATFCKDESEIDCEHTINDVKVYVYNIYSEQKSTMIPCVKTVFQSLQIK